jgi:hypothetical protein
MSCGPSSSGAPFDAPIGGDSDGGGTDPTADRPQSISIDATPEPDGTPGSAYDDADINWGDAGCTNTQCANPVDDMCLGSELCGALGDGDGLDNNCNGVVDEGCVCVPGDVKQCFLGPPGRRGIGGCEDGTMLCEGTGEFGDWGACGGGIWPTGETCDTLDNNCNGCADDHPDCCEPADLACPAPGTLPEGQPFTDYVIDGTMFYPGPAQSWSWTVVGGPCDQLLFATSGTTSYTLTGANTSQVTFHPTLSGDYTFTMTVVAADGTVYTCTFIVHVRGPGVRVELCWDTTGQSDVDLHLHRSGSTVDWFDDNDDCFYSNCAASSYLFGFGAAQWGYANSPLAECSGGPQGAIWTQVGSCHNPRLDIDNISTVGIPENINVDNPNNMDSFRVMVHYYGGSVVSHPMVNIYCGGFLTATYGAAPNQVQGFDQAGGFGGGDMWKVADVEATVMAGVTTGCDITALLDPVTGSYLIETNDTSY